MIIIHLRHERRHQRPWEASSCGNEPWRHHWYREYERCDPRWHGSWSHWLHVEHGRRRQHAYRGRIEHPWLFEHLQLESKKRWGFGCAWHVRNPKHGPYSKDYRIVNNVSTKVYICLYPSDEKRRKKAIAVTIYTIRARGMLATSLTFPFSILYVCVSVHVCVCFVYEKKVHLGNVDKYVYKQDIDSFILSPSPSIHLSLFYFLFTWILYASPTDRPFWYINQEREGGFLMGTVLDCILPLTFSLSLSLAFSLGGKELRVCIDWRSGTECRTRYFFSCSPFPKTFLSPFSFCALAHISPVAWK